LRLPCGVERSDGGLQGFDLVGRQNVWRNLLKHYLLCLDHACILLTLNGSDTPINLASLPVLKTENDLPTQDYKDAFKSACDTFLNTPSVPECAEGLASRQRPIRRDELRCHLRMLHWHALNAIFTAYRERRIQLDASGGEMFRDLCAKMPVRPEVFGMANEFEQRHTAMEGGSDQLYAAMNAIHQQGILIGKYNNPTSPAVRNSSLILAEFPDHYVKLVEKMIHPDWYMACFTESYASPSMWGHYANAHKGVCLKLGIGVTSGKPTLTLNGIVGRRNSKTDPAGQPASATQTIRFTRSHIKQRTRRLISSDPSGSCGEPPCAGGIPMHWGRIVRARAMSSKTRPHGEKNIGVSSWKGKRPSSKTGPMRRSTGSFFRIH